MATWSIEHIPANGGASTFASLGVWGFASLQMQFVNWGIDQAAVTTRGGSLAFEAAQFAYLDKLVVWRNGTRFAHFWITGLGTSDQVQESRTYTLSGPAWWLAHYALEDTSNITLYTAGAYIALGMASAIAAGAPVACSASLSAALNVGCPDVRSAGTVFALVQEAARHVPFSSGWWDCSGGIPVLTASRRSAGDSTTLTIGTDPIESFGLTPLPDQQVKSVCIQFGWTGSSSYYLDYAGTDYTKSGPNRVQVTLNYATPADALQASGCGVAAKYYTDMAAIPWGGSINLHAAEPADITPIRPGRKVNLAGGLAEWATMDALVQSVVWSVSPETNDLCTLNLGAPDQLGIQEYFDLRAAVGSSAAGESAAEPVSSRDPTPGTYDDLPGGNFADIDGSMFTPSPTVALEWCTAADYLTLDGFSEYAPIDESGLSVPWKKYLTRNLSGSVELLSRVGPFVFSYNGYTATLIGSAQYTLGGAYSNTGLLTGVGDLNQGGCSWPSGGGSTAAYDCPNCADLPSPVTTRTSKVVTGAAPTWSGSLRADLADEVTEDALIAYWLANTAAFSGWSSTAGVAAYEPRTTSFQFYYSLLRGRGTGSNAVAGWTYTLEIPTEVRTYGSTGAWSAGESVTSEVVADSSGNFALAEVEIRAPRGYERRPTGTCRVLTGIPGVDGQS